MSESVHAQRSVDEGLPAERSTYLLDHEAAQRFLYALEHPSPHAEQGLRQLIDKPSVLPEA